MFGKRLRLFKLLGFPVQVDLSWVIIAVLITWSLAEGIFPASYPDLAPAIYWGMGIAGALGLFLCIILHEVSHAVAARRYGLPMKGITLFIFGGVAEMEREPPSGKAEFVMAIAGPIASVVIALVCSGAYLIAIRLDGPAPVQGVFAYLAMINGVLVAFNLIPAFPLDGGRVLRAALWHFKGNLRWATRISSQIGSGFGLALIIVGVVTFINGNFIGGMWWFLIGMFLRSAAQMSYQQVLIRRLLEGELVRDIMRTDPVTVSPSTSVQDLVDEYIYQHHFKMFPVVENGALRGCVTTRDVRKVPREEWTTRTVGSITDGCSHANTVSADADAMGALSRMNRTGKSRLLALDGDRLVGVVALKDLLKHLSLRIELEEDDEMAKLGPLRAASELA
jgi:Zn-dependent protease/predicted transcriptional regulator